MGGKSEELVVFWWEGLKGGVTWNVQGYVRGY